MDFSSFSKMAAPSASEPLCALCVLFSVPAALIVHRAHSRLFRCSHQSGLSQPWEAFSCSRSPTYPTPSFLFSLEHLPSSSRAYVPFTSVCACLSSYWTLRSGRRLCLEWYPMHTVGLHAHWRRYEKPVETHAHLLLRPRSQWSSIKTWTQQNNGIACPVVSKGTNSLRVWIC